MEQVLLFAVLGLGAGALIAGLGLETERGRLKVGADLQVPGHPDVFAAGDAAAVPDLTQPGIAPIVQYLQTLPYHPAANCATGHFYMVNNLSPGFLPNGTIDTTNILTGTKVPPSDLRTIGDALNEAQISWAYYGGGYDAAVRVANGTPRDAFDTLVAAGYQAAPQPL